MANLPREQTLALLDQMLAPTSEGGLYPLRSKPNIILPGAVYLSWLSGRSPATSGPTAAAIAAELVCCGGLVLTDVPGCGDPPRSFSAFADYRHAGAAAGASAKYGVINALLPPPSRSKAPAPAGPLLYDVFAGLNAEFGVLCKHILQRNGHEVAYEKVREQPAWARVLGLLSELAVAVAPGSVTSDREISESFRKASFCNLYNICIIHAKLIYGHPTTLSKRGVFFKQAAYAVCGVRLCTSDLEHKVLRCKVKSKDPVFPLRLRSLDPRMHFILNCGARSCPPIHPLAASNDADIEMALQDATLCFIDMYVRVKAQSDASGSIPKRKDTGDTVVTLSRLFKWFRNVCLTRNFCFQSPLLVNSTCRAF
jgi:Protein of unknown function, DUF547